MSDTNTNQNTQQQQPTTPTPEASGGQGGERMFSQSELDRIVQDRLARDRANRQPATDLAAREQALAEQLKAFEQQKFDFALEQALLAAKPRNIKALLPFLDKEKLSMKDGKITGLEEQLDALRMDADTAFLFGPARPVRTSLSHQYGGEGIVGDGEIADAFKPKGMR